MTEREQVIAELLYLKHDCLEGSATDQTLNKAIALLKAQEPRVMTLEEVKSAWRNRDIAFLVEYNDGGNPVWMLYYGYLSTLEEIVLIDEIAHLRHFGVDGYGVDWRCWTSRPDEKRRAETPWN
jgi:hypothetical protein